MPESKMNRRRAISTIGKIAIGAGIAVAIGGGTAAYLVRQPTTPSTTITAAGPRPGGTLRFHIPVDPIGINPVTSGMIFTLVAGGAVFDRLIRRDWDQSKLPMLASTWSNSTDGLTYTFNLVKNARWHDGKPFTADDVVFTFRDVAPKFFPRYNQFYTSIDTVDKLDDYTVQFKLKNPSPDFLDHLSTVEGGTVIPRHIYEGTDVVKNPANSAPIGTGPFKFVNWEKGVAIRLTRNDDYYVKGKPYLDGIVFVVLGSFGGVAPAFRSGDLDLVYFLPTPEVLSLSTVPDAVVVNKFPPSFQLFKMQFNLRDPILKNTKVRQALYYATDRSAIVQKVFAGAGSVPTSVIADTPVTSRWHNPNTMQYPYDPDMAGRVLDDAGYPKDSSGKRFQLELLVEPVEEHLNQVEILRDQWTQIGIDARIKQEETALWTQDMFVQWNFQTGNVWYFGGPTPVDAIGYLLTSQINHALFTNNMGWSNSRFDELFAKQNIETDEKTRKQELDEMQAIVMADPPELFLVAVANTFVFRKQWHDVPPPVGNPAEWFGDVWVEQ